MKITPLDIQQQQFSVRFRGFDTNEVDTFLETVANEFEELIRINRELKEELERKEARILEYQNMEKTLKETLLMAQATSEEMRKMAQKAAEEIKANAQKEAAFTISRTREQAEKIIVETNLRLAKIQEEINELKRKKIIIKQELRSLLETHLRLLDATPEKESREIEEKIPRES
ncbi:MAG: DivIVA domain-containing protein [Desulfobacterota bacterium]|nr:DivIVA domain-containing protein [Thermodesulfobacteriota bacterium]